MAVDPGDWRKVHRIKRTATPDLIEEGVPCYICGAMLVASPDDDIDPIKNGKAYDKEIYHTFVKPPDFEWPTLPQYHDRSPQAGEWVVAIDHYVAPERGADIKGCEGKLEEVSGDMGTVMLGGFLTMLTKVEVPLSILRPVLFHSYYIGVAVRVRVGTFRSHVGKITDILPDGVIEVSDINGSKFGRYTSDQLSPHY